MKQHLAPILFHDNDEPAAAAKRTDPVAAPQRSNTALAKASRKHTNDHYPVHSFTSLLADLATICANQIQPTDDIPAFTLSPPPPRCSTGLRTTRCLPPPRSTVVHAHHKTPAQPHESPHIGGTSD